MLVVLLMTIGIEWTLYANISTFYPPYRLKHHKSINDFMVGIVLAFFEVSLLISSPIISIMLEKIGRKTFILIGTLMTFCACLGFGMLVYVKDDTSFFILSLVVRAI